MAHRADLDQAVLPSRSPVPSCQQPGSSCRLAEERTGLLPCQVEEVAESETSLGQIQLAMRLLARMMIRTCQQGDHSMLISPLTGSSSSLTLAPKPSAHPDGDGQN